MGINRISTYLPSTPGALLRRCRDGARGRLLFSSPFLVVFLAAAPLPLPTRSSYFTVFAGRGGRRRRRVEMEIFRGGIISESRF